MKSLDVTAEDEVSREVTVRGVLTGLLFLACAIQ